MFLKDEGTGKSVILWRWEVKGERSTRVKIMFLPENNRIKYETRGIQDALTVNK